ncbi:hypothetical protein [Streptomyces sp. WM6372]|uniref:hypothetical protein n=1 Tax=Streptomyces sp. WM6372 TaxID=1415555 RepID=UPI000A3E3A78|nr:hypothetical protein [Streptomyces sp. WM6372]
MQPSLVERDADAPLVAARPAGAVRGASGVKISPQRIHERVEAVEAGMAERDGAAS